MLYDHPDLYDEQYKHYRDDLSFYTRLADDYGSPVLELGAGTGRVTAALAKAGHRVTGLELSPAMVSKAQSRLQSEGLGKHVTLVQGDMRSFELEKTFNLVIAPFNAFMHLYTLQAQDETLSRIRQHLSEDGVFACDLYNPHFGALETLRREDEWDHVGGDAADLFVYQSHDADKQLVTSRYYLDKISEDGTLKRERVTLTQRYYTRFEFERALAQNGFSHVRFYGHFDRRPYSREEPHLIAIAKR